MTDPGRDTLISAGENRRMFDGIAGQYDRLNRVLSLGLDRAWRRRAVAELSPVRDGTYLDVGCGSGDMALEICRQAPGARVWGIDPSHEMLAEGAAKVSRAGLEECITLAPGDALALEGPDGDVSGMVTAFCLRNVEDQCRALEEMHRVVATRGRVVILELTRPQSPVVRLGHRLYNRLWVPLVGRLLSKSGAYSYLVNSIEHFPSQDQILHRMRQAGFATARAIPLSGGVVTVFVGEKTAL